MITGFGTAGLGIPGAGAAAFEPHSCTGTIVIVSLRFSPPSVRAGLSSTGLLVSRNCTTHAKSEKVTWTGKFTGAGAAVPKGCPAVDPVTGTLRYTSRQSLTTKVTRAVPKACTAKGFKLTAKISDSTGHELAKKSATLRITQPKAPTT